MAHLFFIFGVAFLAGFIPVLIWLWVLEHEDKTPEPKKLVFAAFISGMLSVLLVIPLERAAQGIASDQVVMFIMWAAIEEIAKFCAAYVSVLRRAENHEPIDSLMYMIAAALGFSALENVLFILNPLLQGNFHDALITGSVRFIGATLLHTVSSSIVGLALAFSFYKIKELKRFYLVFGLVMAIVLHAFFNLSIILSDGSKATLAFYTVWIALVVILLLIEKVKQIRSR